MNPRPGGCSVRAASEVRVCAVFGDPVAHSLSPAMHNAGFRALRLPYTYGRFRVPAARLAAALDAAVALRWRGINLTIPLKEPALGLMDRVTEQARRVGAVNTVTITDGVREGHNTDGEGFLRSLAEAWSFRPAGTRVVIVGAGGAARAVAFALAAAAAREVVVLNRTRIRAVLLAREVAKACGTRVRGRGLARGAEWNRVVRRADLLVNATSVGMHREREGAFRASTVVPAEVLRPPLRVADLVYNPPETALLRAARRRGLDVVNGEGMLVHQGALAFERWTGRRAPVAVLRRALFRALRASG